MESARLVNVAPCDRGGIRETGKHDTILQGWKMQDWKTQDRFAGGGKREYGKLNVT